MTARFKARSDDGVDSRLFKKDSFVRSRGRSDGDDFLRTAFVEDFFRRDSVDEAEDGHLCIEQDSNLIFKLDRNVRRVRWEGAAQGLDVWGEWRQASRKGFAVGSVGTVIFHRDPQIHCEWFGRECANFSDDVFDC